MSWHPCDRYSCPEWHGGQCYGGGCRLNPEPKRNEAKNENEYEEED